MISGCGLLNTDEFRSHPTTAEPLLGAQTQQLTKMLNVLRSTTSPGALPRSGSRVANISETLFDALVAAKTLTSQVAMHLNTDWRRQLFKQLDQLHDPEEWEDGDSPVSRVSFSAFLKMMLSARPDRRPGLGISDAGHLVASWTVDRDRLTIRFQSDEHVTWTMSRYDQQGIAERFAGQVSIARLMTSLAAHNPGYWFDR